MSSEESESSLKDGSDESSLICLRRFFLLLRFFFFDLESDEDVFDDESDDEGSGSGSHPVGAFSSYFELSVDRVILLSSNVVTTSVYSVNGIFLISRSKTSLVLKSEFLI